MRTLALLLTVLELSALPGRAENAPVGIGSADFRPAPDRPFGWRGDGSGRYPDATPPTEWSPEKNVRWSAVVGRSYSSPVVTDALAIVTSEPNLVVAVDRATGKEKWRVEVAPAGLAEEKDRKQAEAYKLIPGGAGLAAATPVTDGRNVYVVLANGIVRALGLDGSTRWTAFIGAEQNNSYGRSASPILAGGRLVVHVTDLYALDAATGKVLWVNPEAKCTYGTPAVLRSGDEDLIVTPKGDVVRAKDGKTVASGIGTGFNTSPVALDGLVYYGEREVKAVRLDAAFKDEDVWTCPLMGEIFGSPLVHDGVLFTVTARGDLFAYNARGKGSSEPIIDARPLFGDEVGAEPIAYASLTLAGRYLYINSLKGDIVVLEATREAKRVATNRLKEGSGASPVFSGKELFLRDGDRLCCIAP